jgi:hypothetical protein
MNALLKLLSIALVTQRTVAALGATIVITIATLEYMRKKK